MVGLAEALIASGWLGAQDEALESLKSLSVGADVLPALSEVARRRMGTLARPKTKTGRSTRPPWGDVLTWAMQRGAKLTLGWPECESRPLERWLGPRLLWWPRGEPEGRKVAWVSSRLVQTGQF